MTRWIAAGGGGLVALSLGLWLALLVSFRTGHVTAIRRINRRFTNPRVLKTAGQPGATASVIRHVGRSSGAVYETPVGVIDAGETMLVALPYGTVSDWLKNVRAAGSAVVVHEGETVPVDTPQVVPAADVADHQRGWDRFVQRLYGVNLVLRLHKSVRAKPAGS